MRRYDIDFIRVWAFVILILFHVGMVFVPWGFFIQNSVLYPQLEVPMLFFHEWRLHLLFLISGMGTYFAIGSRSGWQFIKQRFKRLFIPLIFGIMFVNPPQVYWEKLDKGTFSGSYFFDFFPLQAWSGSYPEGNLTWNHLWFILYLLIFSIVLTPVFVYFKRHPEYRFRQTLQKIVSKTWGLYLFIVPLFLWQYFVAPHFPPTNMLFRDYYLLLTYGTIFFFGFLLLTLKDTFWDNVTRHKRKYLACGIMGFLFYLLFWYASPDFPGKYIFNSFIKVFNIWSWLLAVCGYCATHFNKPSKALSYANEAVYPFYILHQTVILGLVYYLKDVYMPFFPKFALMSVATFAITWIIYEFGIRRINFIRPLFGMKPKSKTK